jgi:hypothetical protein
MIHWQGMLYGGAGRMSCAAIGMLTVTAPPGPSQLFLHVGTRGPRVTAKSSLPARPLPPPPPPPPPRRDLPPWRWRLAPCPEELPRRRRSTPLHPPSVPLLRSPTSRSARSTVSRPCPVRPSGSRRCPEISVGRSRAAARCPRHCRGVGGRYTILSL